MSSFTNVLTNKAIALPPVLQPKKAPKKKSSKDLKVLGCTNCTLNKVEGIRKIKGLVRIKRRKVFLWAQAPGSEENKEGRELVGPAGRLLWEELENVGITRDMCDIQNVVRCRPTQYSEETGRIVDRTPSKEEAKCCSIYTDEALALNAGKAVVHMVFGQFAATTLLGREYKKDTPIFWSEKLQAKVVVLDHPSYFLRGAPAYRLKQWRMRLQAAAKIIEAPGQFAYIDKQQYKSVTKLEHAKQVLKLLKKTCNGRRVSVDIEDGIIDPDTGRAANEGVRVILAVGICWRPGRAYTFFIDHPEIFSKNRSYRDKLIDLLGSAFLSNPTIKKVLQHGTHDVKRFKELWGVSVKGYNFDTNYSSYLMWPDQRKHGLEEQAKQHVPMFAGYKDMVKPYLDAVKINYATIPMSVMRRYNGADADLCKRMELVTQRVDGPLLRVYTKAAFVVDDMQTRGPYLDYKYYNQVQGIIPVRRKKIAKRLKEIAGNPDINLNAPQQCATIIYDKLKLPVLDPDGKRGTADGILALLAQEKKGEFPKLLGEHRKLVKMEGTYLNNYKISADMYEGMLRTIWWLTGTITGRLRSGGKDEPGIVNLQNLHGDDLLLNLLVSDVRWRVADKLGHDIVGELWGKIKKLRMFTAWDYAQIEIRILAHMSEDPKLIRAVLSGDIHSTVGHELTGLPVSQIKSDKDTRTMIKGLHFGIVYGLTPKNLFTKLRAEGVRTTLSRTEELHAKYFKTYRRVRDLIEHLKDFAQRKGYVETIFGFRRPIYTGENDSGRTTFWGNQAVNCVDFKTEILTNNGWRKYNEIKLSDKVLSVKDDGTSVWDTPKAINICAAYNGPTEYWRNKSFSAVTTPNHRWLVRYRGRLGRVHTTEAMPYWDVAIPRTSKFLGAGTNLCSDDSLRLIGWVLTDGFFPKQKKWVQKSGVGVCQSKPDNVKRINALLHRLAVNEGVTYSSRPPNKRNCVYWGVSGPISTLIRKTLPEKILTAEFIATLSARQARILLRAMMRGDGNHDYKNGSTKDSFCCKTKKQADMFQMLCQVAGIPTSSVFVDLSKYNATNKQYPSMDNIPKMTSVWGVTLLRRKFIQLEHIKRNRRLQREKARGVWCIETSTGFFVARREGQTFVTGNSPIQGSAHQLMLCGMSLLATKKQTFNLLQTPVMEVHDAFAFYNSTFELRDSYKQGKILLESSIPQFVEDEFKFKLKVPIEAECKAGYRLGVLTKYEGGPVREHISKWQKHNQEIDTKVEKEWGKLKAA